MLLAGNLFILTRWLYTRVPVYDNTNKKYKKGKYNNKL